MSALKQQPGGSHYKQMAIQPIEYITRNGIGYMPGNVIKYVSRYQLKNGAEDLKKAIHYCELMLEMEYGQSEADIDPRNPSGEGNKILNARAKADAEAKYGNRNH